MGAILGCAVRVGCRSNLFDPLSNLLVDVARGKHRKRGRQ
jgi:hypothetical protein